MSLSLDPRLIPISVDKGATCYACFELQNGFTVNFLSEGQARDLAPLPAAKGADKFAGLRWRAGQRRRRSSGTVSWASVECKIASNVMMAAITPSLRVKLLSNVNAMGERAAAFLQGWQVISAG